LLGAQVWPTTTATLSPVAALGFGSCSEVISSSSLSSLRTSPKLLLLSSSLLIIAMVSLSVAKNVVCMVEIIVDWRVDSEEGEEVASAWVSFGYDETVVFPTA